MPKGALLFLVWVFRSGHVGRAERCTGISSFEGLKCRRGLSQACCAVPGTYDDKREKCDEKQSGCGRVHGRIGGHERPGKNCGDWSQLSLVGSMGPTHRIENPRAPGCGETPEFEGTSKKIRVESGPQEEMPNSRGPPESSFSLEVNSKTLSYESPGE